MADTTYLSAWNNEGSLQDSGGERGIRFMILSFKEIWA